MKEVNWYLVADPLRSSTIRNSELPAASECQALWRGRRSKQNGRGQLAPRGPIRHEIRLLEARSCLQQVNAKPCGGGA